MPRDRRGGGAPRGLEWRAGLTMGGTGYGFDAAQHFVSEGIDAAIVVAGVDSSSAQALGHLRVALIGQGRETDFQQVPDAVASGRAQGCAGGGVELFA